MDKPINAFSGKHVLLLQGPLGPFFRRLSRDLTQIGARVSKVNFNGGDWLFYPTGAVQFRDRMDEWPSFLAKLFADREIDVVMMYGDCRPVHRDVRRLAEQAGVEMGVFEAGYIRPNYITLERSGINDYSSLPRSADFYAKLSTKKSIPPRNVGSIFWHAALWAILYYIASSILRPLFPHYVHHRRLAAREAFPWIRGLWRKYYFYIKERKVRQKLETDYSGRFFLVPLQVHYDSQMRVHSDYESVEAFIRHVVSDFGKNAASDMYLVLKHHPMDRAYRDYTRVCETFAEMYDVRGRLLYMHDLDLPRVFKHTRGVVVVNSTVGLSALFHGLPVKVCGRSIYNIPGLTFTGFLSRFWGQAASAKPNQEAARGLRHFLIEHTQMNGSVYRRLSDTESHAGIVWNDAVSLLKVLAAKEFDAPLLKVEPSSVSIPHRRLGL